MRELSFGLNRQSAIYAVGADGNKPSQPISVEDLQRRAQAVLPSSNLPAAFAPKTGR